MIQNKSNKQTDIRKLVYGQGIVFYITIFLNIDYDSIKNYLNINFVGFRDIDLKRFCCFYLIIALIKI